MKKKSTKRKNKETPHPCVVCNRMAGVKAIVDGEIVVICFECEDDDFRRKYAVPFTKRNEERENAPRNL